MANQIALAVFIGTEWRSDPNTTIDADLATQIEKYAFAVATDERFNDVRMRQVFLGLVDTNRRAREA
jgi:hypothetical protein